MRKVITLVDAHCHLDDPQFAQDSREVILRAQEAAVGMITVGTTLRSSERAVTLAEAYDGVWACVGIHPEEVEEGEGVQEAERHLAALAKQARVVAIGECGLDYARVTRHEAHARQLPWFEAQIALAARLGKPLMLHIRPSARGSRDAYEDVLEVLASFKRSMPQLRGNAHFFAADVGTARRFFDLDFTVSFTGVLTFAPDYQEVARELPRDRVLVETDAPYVAPVPHRGRRNEPRFVREVARTLAQLWGVEEGIAFAQLLRNTQAMFGVPPVPAS